MGYPHEVKGKSLYAFVILNNDEDASEKLKEEIRKQVAKVIGAIAKPEKIQFVPELPKTRSGKIMRRILRKIAANQTEDLGDISTLENDDIVKKIIDKAILD